MKRDEQIRMVLHPEEYSDEQLGQMLDEASIPVPDADEAWKELCRRTVQADTPSFALRASIKKIAAVFVGVLVLSGLSFAAYRLSMNVGSTHGNTIQEKQTESRNRLTESQVSAPDSTQAGPVVYENAELATILSDVASFYKVKTVYKSEGTKHIRLYFTWSKDMTINEVVGTFNQFERIHITRDNKQLTVE